MPALLNSKHERFCQAVAKGLSVADAFASAGYSKTSAASNSKRLRENEGISSRIKELQTRISDAVVLAEIRKRSWRVQQLQSWADDMLALRAARKKLYGKPDSGERTVANAEEQAAALAEGFELVHAPKPAGDAGPAPEWPKTLMHPGWHIGGDTGMLVKDFRGKNAEQEIWKFDAALVEKFANVLKQAAIEEGQWTEKRDMQGSISINTLMEKINQGRKRVAEAKIARDKVVAIK